MPDYGFNTGGANPRDAIGFILDLLEQQQTTRINEANSWAGGLETVGQAIGMASNSGALGEWDSLVGEWLEQGEEYSSLTGNPQYEMIAKLADTTYRNKKNQIDAFEGALTSQANIYHDPGVWNVERFKDAKKGLTGFKEGDEYDQAWIDYVNDISGKPMRFAPNVSHEDLSEFVNLHSEASIKGIIPEDKSIAHIMMDLKNQYQNKMNAITNMGVSFDAQGNITNLAQLGDIKQTYSVGGVDYGIQELARDAWDSQRIYNNFEYAVTNQNIPVEGVNSYYNASTGRNEMKAGEPRSVSILTPGEVQWIFDSQNITEFKLKQKEMIGTLKSNMKETTNLITQKQKIASSLAGSLKEAGDLSQLSQSLKGDDVRKAAENMGLDPDQLSPEQITMMIQSINGDIASLNDRITDIYTRAIAWGGHDEVAKGDAELAGELIAAGGTTSGGGDGGGTTGGGGDGGGDDDIFYSITNEDIKRLGKKGLSLYSGLSQTQFDDLVAGQLKINEKDLSKWGLSPTDFGASPVGAPGEEGVPTTDDIEWVKGFSEKGHPPEYYVKKFEYIDSLNSNYGARWLEYYDADEWGEWRVR